MIAHAVWFGLALPFFLLDAWLAPVAAAPDLTLVLALFCGLFARPSALPALLICAALARSVVVPGSLALHLLVLGIPVALLVPLRLWLFRRRLLLQLAAVVFLAHALPALAAYFARFPGAGLAGTVVRVDAGAVSLLGLLLVAPATWLLCALPPWRQFVERRE